MAGDWLTCYRLAAPTHLLEARRSPGGEPYGKDGFGLVTEPGQWLCRNPANDYRWVCSDSHFDQLYCEVGKTPIKKRVKALPKGRSQSYEESRRSRNG